jgi:hypothetical protein
MHKNKLFILLKNQSGQALLIIVLVLVVALTVGLSIASRSITNLRTTQDQASSQKALSAAEAGAEQAIISQNKTTPITGSLSGNTTYSSSIASVSGVTPFFMRGSNSQTNEITKGNPVYIWTTVYSASQPFSNPWSGALTVYWGDSNGPSCPNSNVPALEVTVISNTKASPILQRFAYDPCSRGNGFSSSNTNNTANFSSLKYYASLPSINNIYLVSVNPLYADTRIGVSAINSTSQTLPYQGANIVSTGIDNQVQRKVYVFEGYPQLPAEFFPYTIFSP